MAEQLAQAEDLDTRLGALIAGLRDRLSAKSFAFIAEQPEYGEPELAIDMLWEQVDSAEIVLSEVERRELLELTAHPAVAAGALSHGRTHLPSRDIGRH